MPKRLYLCGPAKTARQWRWRVEWRDHTTFVTVDSTYRTKVVAIMDAYWRVLITPGWTGEVVLFDQHKGE